MDLREDEGVEIQGVRVRCDYIGYINGRAVAVIEKSVKSNEVSSLNFVKAYARFCGFRYAGVISDRLKIYDLKEKKFVDEVELDFIEPDEKFGKLALLFFVYTSCHGKREQ